MSFKSREGKERNRTVKLYNTIFSTCLTAVLYRKFQPDRAKQTENLIEN